MGFPPARAAGRWFHNGDIILPEDLNINIMYTENSQGEITTVLERTNADKRASGSYVFSTMNPVQEISELVFRIIHGWLRHASLIKIYLANSVA